MSKESKQPKEEKGYEVRDANVNTVVWSGVGLFILIAFAMVIILGTFRVLQERRDSDVAPPSLAEFRQPKPDAPRLQVNPDLDWQEFNARQDSVLNSYGWVMREAGLVRIPVDSAMKLLLERGLPVRPDYEQWQTEDR